MMTRPKHWRAATAALLLSALALPGLSPAVAAQPSRVAQEIADRFAATPTMSGSFVQFDPDGGQSEGTFRIQRPGKIRFDYAGRTLRVVSDGRQVAVNNRKLNTWDLYPLSRTPLRLLLGERIDLSDAGIRSVEEGADLTKVVMEDRSAAGGGRITMMFDARTRELRQWTVRDGRGKDTTVVVSDVRTDARIDPKEFAIPYTAIAQGQTGNRR